VITLERTACRGQCAEYKLAFYEDGQVVYDGRANSSKAGRWYAHVTPETVGRLASEFKRIGYDSLAPKYPPGLTDSPIASTSLRAGTRIKTVTHEEGSPFPPPALSVLEDRLDAAVQSVDWAR
jgi:(2Fe-2S) ferredoxin